MTDYGVQSSGFVRKPISVILSEIEAQNRTEFGAGVIQTAETPLGQLNGIFAELSAKLWELGEDIYQSYDPDQAEGNRLEMLGRIRLADRADSETDESYRQGITNAGSARVDIQDISRAVAALEGVTYSHVFINDTGELDGNGMPGASICVAVTGGADDDIAKAIRTYIVPGVAVHGNTSISSVIDGFCRNLRILRPIEVPVDLTVTVRAFKDNLGCPPPAATAIKTGLIANLYLLNGDDIDHYRIRTVIENLFSNVEVISFNGKREGIEQEDDTPVVIGFIERAVLDAVTIVVI
jgi:hypothetical protein